MGDRVRAFPIFLLSLVAYGAPAWGQAANPCRTYETEIQRSACDAAISAATDLDAKASLLYTRAYNRVEVFDYDNALLDLGQVLALEPSHLSALHERAYIWNEMGEFENAEADLDTQVRLTPDRTSNYTERAYARFYQADFQGSYEDRVRAVDLKPSDGDAVLAMARAALWLGRFDDTRRHLVTAGNLAANTNNKDLRSSAEDLVKVLALWETATPGGAHADVCREAEKTFKFDQPNLIGNCTAAFLAAPDAKTKAEILTTRSLAWKYGVKDEYEGLGDMRAAVGLQPQNADWRSNLGFAYLDSRHSWAAEREFDRAIAVDRSFAALAGRASARFNQREYDGAFEDAKASFEIQPNEVALIVLGDLSMRKGDKAASKQYWMGAYHLGSRDDRLIERLKDVGVSDPAKEPRE